MNANRPLAQLAPMIGATLAMLLLTSGCESETAEKSEPAVSIGTVSVVIDFPDDFKAIDFQANVPISADSTVLSVLKQCQHDDGLEFVCSKNAFNDPATAFIKSICGLGDEGGKYWTYYINGSLANKGCGVQSLQADDRIRWAYGETPEF